MRTHVLLAISLLLMLIATTAVAENEVLNKAGRYIQSGDYDQAIELLTDYTRSNPSDGVGLITLANALPQQG